MKIVLLVSALAISFSIQSMTYNEVNSIPPSRRITVDWDIDDHFYDTSYQGTAYDSTSTKRGVVVLSIAKPSWLECCLGKKIREAQIRHLVINVWYEESLIQAAQLKIAENQDIDELFISLKHDDHAGALFYQNMGFEEEKPTERQKPGTLVGKLLCFARKRLVLQEEQPSRKKFIYNFLKDLKED